MPLSRPLFSHRLAPSFLRTVVQCAEAGVLLLAFRLLSSVVGGFMFGDPVSFVRELRFGGVVIVGAIAGGVIYALLRAIVTRRGVVPALGVRIVLVLVTGASLGAVLSLRYWRRPEAPGRISHEGLTLLAAIAGVAIALSVAAVVAWQERIERTARAGPR